MALTAVVLAGGPPDAVSACEPGAPNKAFVHVGGVALVERTLRALREAASVARLIAVAPRAAHSSGALALADERRDDGARIDQSLTSGLAGLPLDRPVLIAAADLPVLTAAAVDDFAARYAARELDAAYGIVERRVHERRFAAFPHTYAHMREGVYCGAGLFVLKPRVVPALVRFLDDLGRARKAPLRLAAIFGYDVLMRFVVRRLSIAQAEERASVLLAAPAGAIVSPFAEIALNVDRQSDLTLAQGLFTA